MTTDNFNYYRLSKIIDIMEDNFCLLRRLESILTQNSSDLLISIYKKQPNFMIILFNGGREQKESTGYFPDEYQLNKQLKYFKGSISSAAKYGVASRVAAGYTLFINFLKEVKYLRSIGQKPTRKVKPSRIKNKKITKSFTLHNDISKKIISDDGTSLFLNRMFKKVKCSKVRDGISSDMVKRCTIKRLPSGKYYAYLSIRGESPKKVLPVTKKNTVGIDPGIAKFVTLSDGKYLDSSNFYDRSLRRRIRRAQRKLSRRTKGSRGYRKQKRYIAKLHEKIANRRYDFQMKLAHWLANNYKVLCLEDLQSSFMMKKKGGKKKSKSGLKLISLSFKSSDAAHYQFKMLLGWMANKYNSELVLVNPENTSQLCCRCGQMVPKTIQVRTHSCPHCNLVMDRDHNAANNILFRGLGQLEPLKGTVWTTGTVERFVYGVISKINLDSTTTVEIDTSGW